jgi:hypothetical protein
VQPQCRAMPASAPGRASRVRAATTARVRPSGTRERQPWGNGHRVRVGAAWGETDAYINRYHEHRYHSKRAPGARTEPDAGRAHPCLRQPVRQAALVHQASPAGGGVLAGVGRRRARVQPAGPLCLDLLPPGAPPPAAHDADWRSCGVRWRRLLPGRPTARVAAGVVVRCPGEPGGTGLRGRLWRLATLRT